MPWGLVRKYSIILRVTSIFRTTLPATVSGSPMKDSARVPPPSDVKLGDTALPIRAKVSSRSVPALSIFLYSSSVLFSTTTL